MRRDSFRSSRPNAPQVRTFRVAFVRRPPGGPLPK
jgi:hypothetical protein